MRWLIWVQVPMAALAMVATLPGRTHGLGMITERLLADLRLDRVTYASINLWATLLGGLACIPVGWLLERYGSRRVLTGVVVMLGAVVLGMSWISPTVGESVASAVGGGVEPTVALVALLFIAVLFTRGLGQSALSVVSLSLVGKWQRRRLGLGMGLFSVLVVIGFMVCFGIAQGAQDLSWQAVWSFMGIVLLVGVVPMCWLLVRDSPETCGLPLDAVDPNAPTPPPGYTLSQALLTPGFWVFGLASSLYGLITAGQSLFNESILNDRGFDTNVFYNVAIATPFAGMAGNFVGGLVASRWPINRLLCIAMATMAAAMFGLPFVGPEWAIPIADNGTVLYPQLAAFAMAYGLAGGVVTVVFFAYWAKAFGRDHLGPIQGAAQMQTVIASAIGPLLLAGSKEYAGSYVPMFYTLAAVAAAFALAAAFTPMPRPLSGPTP